MSVLQRLKKEMRLKMAETLKNVENIGEQSENVGKIVMESEWFRSSRRMSVYVSTKGEIQTDQIIRFALEQGKQVFIPMFTKGNRKMEMIEVPSQNDFDKLPITLWGIRQPDPTWNWQKYEEAGPLDIVLVPGVAFTKGLKRLGHGMGYYDRWLSLHLEKFGKMPRRVGLALREQIVDDVPTGDNDVDLEEIVVDH